MKEINMCILDNIKNGKYEIKLEYPRTIAYRCPSCDKLLNHSFKFCPNCGQETKFERLSMERRVLIKEYNKEESRLYNVFKDDCLKEVGLENHPKREDIFSFAYDRARSGGYQEVFNFLDDLSELFK
jgi:hypothetical protein